ncbi:hypothetical protein GGS23DRAFT_597163 [Durotheca rogersii]|uniref:uncharacterized protein n=1 Tax=Durotheca rogersii TaxID=419775 RepID=UPI00221F4F14|nr:uncharacterized protein GGS23DRAFT_597163 [Durotheca rogersii]KAI5862848.1 hypothetical protein GGS23DRAFT_597163 [Durotheca rogersii]
MATTARYSPDPHTVPRRDTSPGWPRTCGDRRRPRLLRSCVTEPSITTSNACNGLLTSPNSSQRATELLSRVAFSNAASSPSSTRSFSEEVGEARDPRLTDAACNSQSAGYFSFPSFDMWEAAERLSSEKAIDRATA